MNLPDKKSNIPVPPAVSGGTVNLLSNIAPPTELPNFVTSTPTHVGTSVDMAATQSSSAPNPVPIQPVVVKMKEEQPVQPMESFSPAIPLSKGEPMLSIRSPEDSETTQTPESLQDLTPEIDRLGDVMPGSGLLTWMKGAVATGGILQRVAEKAKSSVDSMITTLDPQMKEYLRSGGDMFIVIASHEEYKISPIREAFQTTFGKATITGHEANSEATAVQPVGYAAAYAAAKQRIAHVRATQTQLTNNVPIVAVETYLVEAIADRWFDMSLLVLSQPSLGVELQQLAQGVPVPSAAVAALRHATPEDYEHSQTGYSLTIRSVMADSLQVPQTQWQEASTGVSQRELLMLAAKSLAGSYKRLLAVSAAET